VKQKTIDGGNGKPTAGGMGLGGEGEGERERANLIVFI